MRINLGLGRLNRKQDAEGKTRDGASADLERRRKNSIYGELVKADRSSAHVEETRREMRQETRRDERRRDTRREGTR